MRTAEMTGGEWLARFRREGRKTQQELAVLIGGSRSMVAQIESGERHPSAGLLLEVSRVLQLSEIEQAQLFLAFGRVQENPNYLTYMLAVIRRDSRLSSSQAEHLSALLIQAYQEATAGGEQ